MIEKQARDLVDRIRSYGPVAVALSGGVDSSVVAKAAFLAWSEQAFAITGRSASVPQEEWELARNIARQIGIKHVLLDTNEFNNDRYIANDGTRCYHCKTELYSQIVARREELGVAIVCSGANADDRGDYRPGLQAAAEHGVRHPLEELGYNKEVVRGLARYWELPNWNKPAAPCLSSRIAVGVAATPERTKRVEQAERFLREEGLVQFRVRHHADELARIEVEESDFARLLDPSFRRRTVEQLQSFGFRFVSLDLVSFRSGSLNVMVPAELLRAAGSALTRTTD
ncbi:ATP-dependent sacrificial sulfur transferase LarE [bacterium]|nr:ATP-dependent sacrificial sulfur transferase LarE [bacterium]